MGRIFCKGTNRNIWWLCLHLPMVGRDSVGIFGDAENNTFSNAKTTYI